MGFSKKKFRTKKVAHLIVLIFYSLRKKKAKDTNIATYTKEMSVNHRGCQVGLHVCNSMYIICTLLNFTDDIHECTKRKKRKKDKIKDRGTNVLLRCKIRPQGLYMVHTFSRSMWHSSVCFVYTAF